MSLLLLFNPPPAALDALTWAGSSTFNASTDDAPVGTVTSRTANSTLEIVSVVKIS